VLEAFEHIEEGAVLEGTVVKIMPYGAFIDLGGVEGLAPHFRYFLETDQLCRCSAEDGRQTAMYLVQKFDKETQPYFLVLESTTEESLDGCYRKI
jgi:DNA-directed RNA polymerase subunit E'/Rpb7